jgi:hypothetical protein
MDLINVLTCLERLGKDKFLFYQLALEKMERRGELKK